MVVVGGVGSGTYAPLDGRLRGGRDGPSSLIGKTSASQRRRGLGSETAGETIDVGSVEGGGELRRRGY